MNKIKKILAVVSFFALPLALWAQSRGSLQEDYFFQEEKVEGESPFVVFESRQHFDLCTFCEEKSKIWTLNASQQVVEEFDLSAAPVGEVRSRKIRLSFRPSLAGKQFASSSDARYLAYLATDVKVKGKKKTYCVIVLDLQSGREKSYDITTLPEKNKEPKFNFNGHTLVVAVPGKYYEVDPLNSTVKSKKMKIDEIFEVTSVGYISGQNQFLKPGSKEYVNGYTADCGGFIRYFTSDNHNRYYVRKSHGEQSHEKTDQRWDMNKRYGITDNRVFPKSTGEPGIVFNGQLLGWANNEKLLVLQKKYGDGIVAFDYGNMYSEMDKQMLLSAMTRYNPQKVCTYVKQHPSTPFKSMVVQGLYKMFTSAPDKKFTYSDVYKYMVQFKDDLVLSQYESLLVNYVRNKDDAVDFVKDHPNSNYKKVALGNAFRDFVLIKEEVQQLKNAYGMDFYLNVNDPIASASNETRTNYFRSLYNYAAPENIESAQDFYIQYGWLDYNGKVDDLLDNYWEILSKDPTVSGDVQAYCIRDLFPKMDIYKSWGLDKAKADAYVTRKLQQEFRYITVSSPTVTSSTSEEWEQWKNSAYTAGIVTQKGHRQFLLYGTVTNNSDYSLPVKVNAFSDLFIKEEAQVSLFGIKATISKSGQKEKLLSKASEVFYIPSMAPHSTSIYAILLDFGEGSNNAGLNFADFAKYYQQIYLKNTRAVAEYGTENVSTVQIDKQNEWQMFAKNGLPSNQLTDLWRGEQVQESVWQDRHIEKLRRQAERRARAAAYSTYSGSSGSYSSSSSSSDENVSDGPCYTVIEKDERRVFVDAKTEYKFQHIRIECSSGFSPYHEYIYVPFNITIKGVFDKDFEPGWYYFQKDFAPVEGSGQPNGSKFKYGLEEQIKKDCDC